MHAESRLVVFPAIVDHLQFHIKKRDDLLDKSLDIMSSVLTFLRDQEVSTIMYNVYTKCAENAFHCLECFNS